MRLRPWPPNPWPRSLAARTAVVLLAGLIVVQGFGLALYALDRIDLLRLVQARNVAVLVMGVYRSVVLAAPAERGRVLADLALPPGTTAALRRTPPDGMLATPQPLRRLVRVEMGLVPVPPALHPREVEMLGNFAARRMLFGLLLPEGEWLDIALRVNPPRPWLALDFLTAFAAMTVAAGLLALWAVRELTRPVQALAAAAERLGPDVDAPPLPEDGPAEIAAAAAAFNRMAARIRRVVQDRTLMLSAISHDLRTPITRLKLRSEFIEDDELRRKMLADLDELEALVAATLAFGRDATSSEPVTRLDLAVLARTILDEATDARPEIADRLVYEGPEHLPVRARSLALKRALGNLVANAVKYGGGARLRIVAPREATIRIEIDDDGPGIPPDALDRIFEPFQRIESSRNRETGGVGLGLPIARNILRAHGGDVTLANRPGGGVRAVVTLPLGV